MKRFIVVPDSFKGTLSSTEVCDLIETEIKKVFTSSEVVKIPVADGGEGSVDAFLKASDGKKVFVEVTGPYFERVFAFYGLIDHGKTAVIEMAAAAGLPLVGEKKNPALTTTYGVGELILDAISQGVNKVVLGLGGSATNDGGCGFAAALGVSFLNRQGEVFTPTGGTLSEIASVDLSTLNPKVHGIEFITMCDIDNPLYGEEGAAFIFSPQKGAHPEMVKSLDENLRHLAKIVQRDIGFDEADFAGAGAAGGMGYGAKVFLSSKIQMGIETVLDVLDFDRLAKDADVIITGEGQLDAQSLRGKVVFGVAKRARNYPAKVVAVVGDCRGDQERYLKEGLDAIIVTNYQQLSFEQLKPRAKEDLVHTVSAYLYRLSVLH